MPITRGATPATAMPSTRARGVRPCVFAAAALASSSAQAPSLTPEALPAVIVPFGRTMGFNLPSASSEVSRGCSSLPTTRASPFFCGTVTGVISASKKPRFCASTARNCERSAIASWSARLTPKSSATFSAVSGIESTPYCAFIAGLTKRQPIVVSKIAFSRANADVALGITNGARLMLSTPPASSRPASPARIACAALPTAFRPEPHRRFSVTPGTSTGRPASNALMRATLRLSSPAWLAQP